MQTKKVHIIVQARTNSSRMPGKIIAPLHDGKSFLEVQLNRLKKIDLPIIVATTTNDCDDVIIERCNEIGINCFRGSENNVLNRFIECAVSINAELIVRVCSDNPFIDLKSIEYLVKNYEQEDYLSFAINGTPSILTHYGFFAELVNIRALKKVALSADSQCKEHVTNCIYQNPSRFQTRLIPLHVDEDLPLRCTLDTTADWLLLQNIYQNWYLERIETDFTYIELINFLRTQPNMLSSMDKEIKNNSK